MAVINDVKSWTTSVWENNTEACTKLLKDEKTWNQVPTLNGLPSHCFVDGQLVRFRCMIQDMHNPEFYMASYEIQNSITGTSYTMSGKFRDIVICKPDEEINFDAKKNHAERQSLYCISVPAVNQWALESVLTSSNTSSSGDINLNNRGVKRSAEEDMEVEDGSSLMEQKPSTQRSKLEEVIPESSSTGPHCAQGLNLPLPDALAQACILKIYDAEEKLVLNEDIEVIGFLSLDPNLSCLRVEEGEENMEEQEALHPPASLVPRLHVIALHRMLHPVPLLSKFNFQADVDMALQDAVGALQDLRIVLTPMLLGDQLATDYMVCNLISKIFLRKDVTTLGQFAINFYNIPVGNEYVSNVYKILQQLLPKTHYLPLSLSNLNTTTFIPKKDYKSDLLKSGLLQLSSGTHLIIDETKLSPGELTAFGKNNLFALQSLINKQKVDYDFQFYKMEFNSDLPVLIFSEKKSLLPSDLLFPIDADAESLGMVEQIFEAANMFLKNEPVLNRIRMFLCAARLADYNIPDAVQEKVQEDFVEMRQQDQKMKGDDLHSMLVLARLLTLSKGQQSLTVELWKEARAMEEARRDRLSKC